MTSTVLPMPYPSVVNKFPFLHGAPIQGGKSRKQKQGKSRKQKQGKSRKQGRGKTYKWSKNE